MKKLLYKTISLVLLFSVLLAPAASAEFTDVPGDFWAREYIGWMEARGYVQGDGGGNYFPDDNVTVAEFVAIVCRMTGMDDKGLEPGESHWAEPAMAYAEYMGWYGESDVRPSGWNEPIARQVAAKIVMLALFPGEEDQPLPDKRYGITDMVAIGKAYIPHILRAYLRGILTGYPDGSFMPEAGITRAEAAALLSRAFERAQTERPAAEISDKTLSLPVLMYHHIAPEGEWAVSAEKLERDIKDLLAAGYKTVFLSEVYAYAAGKGELPEKPVVITFDDGYYSNYEYAFPLLEEYDCKAEIAVIGCYVGDMGFDKSTPVKTGHFTWTRAKKMIDSGHIGVISHSWAMHGLTEERVGAMKAAGESYADYITLFTEDAGKIKTEISLNLGLNTIAYAYPYGRSTPLTEKLLDAMGYGLTLSTEPGINKIAAGDMAALRNMKRIPVDSFSGSVVEYIESFQEGTT